MNTLKAFIENQPQKDAVYEYFMQTLKDEIVNKALQGHPVEGYQEAKNIIDRAFSNLEGQYGNKKKTTTDPR